MTSMIFGKNSGSSLDAGTDAVVDPRDTAKYLLRVTAGPSYDASTHGQVAVNGDAFEVDNEFVTASINVRIRDYHGLPRSSPPSHEYFQHPKHKNDRYSISFSIIPKKDIPGDELVMGFDFDRPIRDRLPPLFKPALRLVTSVIDPGIFCDPYSDEPYLYGPGLSSFFVLRIGDKPDIDSDGTGKAPTPSPRPSPRNSLVIDEGADGSGSERRRSYGMPEQSDKRRKYFLKKQNLESFTFEAGREYDADFFNPYLDFANFAVRLPGFSISVAKYIDEKTHQLRYVLKNRKTNEVYFVVVFTLLFGKQLKDALRAEDGRTDESEASGMDTPDSRASSSDVGRVMPGAAQEDDNQHLKPPTAETHAGLVESLGKWLPKILSSGGTKSGATTPGSGRQSPTEGEQHVGSAGRPSNADDQQIEAMHDLKVEDVLREKHGSAADP